MPGRAVKFVTAREIDLKPKLKKNTSPVNLKLGDLNVKE